MTATELGEVISVIGDMLKAATEHVNGMGREITAYAGEICRLFAENKDLIANMVVYFFTPMVIVSAAILAFIYRLEKDEAQE